MVKRFFILSFLIWISANPTSATGVVEFGVAAAAVAKAADQFKKNYCAACKNLGLTMCARPMGLKYQKKLSDLEAKDSNLDGVRDAKEIKRRKFLEKIAGTRSAAGYVCKNLCKAKKVKYLGVIQGEQWWMEMDKLMGLTKCMETYHKMPAVKESWLTKVQKAREANVIKLYIFDEHELDAVMDEYKELIQLSDYESTEDIEARKLRHFKKIVAISEHITDRMLLENPIKRGIQIQAPRIKKFGQSAKKWFKGRFTKEGRAARKNKVQTYTPKNYGAAYQGQSLFDRGVKQTPQVPEQKEGYGRASGNVSGFSVSGSTRLGDKISAMPKQESRVYLRKSHPKRKVDDIGSPSTKRRKFNDQQTGFNQDTEEALPSYDEAIKMRDRDLWEAAQIPPALPGYDNPYFTPPKNVYDN